MAIIVDDEPATRELIEKVLISAGSESLTVTKSEEAPEILRHGKFAVAFLDYEMAFPDGPTLARQMRASGSNRMTPIVLISDGQRPAAMAKGFEAGASFLTFRGQEIEGETANVSLEGMLLRTPRMLPVGSSVDVSLHLHQAMKPAVGAGSVVRVHGHEEMRIHLGRLTMEESQKLQEYLLPLLPGG